MATPKGNFVAYTPLKPTEMKVGELYGKWVDDYIKRGDAERAAKAKLLAEEKKAMGERFDKMKIDPFATISNLQDMGGDMFRKTADYVGRMRMMAEKDFENRHIYLNRAEKAMNDYRGIATAFGNKDFIDKANAKAQAIANHDVFLDTDDNDQLIAISAGMVSYNLDETTGEIYFNLPKNRYSTDEDKAVRLSVGEVLHKYSAPDEINMLYSNKSNGQNGFLDKEIPNVAKVMQDEWSVNKDGNKEESWAGFAKNRANVWFDTTFGGYNANNIDPRLRQYSKTLFKKNIESEEDYNMVKNSLIERIGAYVPQEDKLDTKYTQTQLEGQQLQNKKLKLDISEKEWERANGYPSKRGAGSRSGGSNGGSNSGGAMPMIMNGNSVVQVRDANGKVKGTQVANLNSISLPKLKGMPTSDNSFGLASFINKKGQQVDTWYIGAPSKTGEMVYSKISEKDFTGYINKLGYNPIVVKQALTSTKRSFNRYSSVVNSQHEGKGVQVAFKAKVMEDNNEDW